MKEKKMREGSGGMPGGVETGVPERGRRSRRKGKVMIVVGASLILAGLLTLAGIYCYIYYTDRKAASAQEELFRKWEEEPTSSEEGDYEVGDGIARIIAPEIELDAIVVALWGLDDAENLKRGPGHIPGTANPGQPGNCVISGHRTTYGAPFRRIEELKSGDEITLLTATARYVYEVYEQRIVLPTDLTVLEQQGEPKLTLTACHPWYSAAQRIVVIARLAESPDRDAENRP